jgi:hypothetical protein
MKSTWIGDPTVELALHSAFEEVNLDFSAFYEANSLSNEERLTGVLAKTLIDKFDSINDVLRTWGRTVSSGPWYIKLYYKDMTVNRGEKERGADLAFVLDVKIPGKNEFRKAILLQAKKMQSRKVPEGIIFENYWKIDVSQAEKILKQTKSAFHIFYNPDHKGLGIRILPTVSLLSLSKAIGNTTVLHASKAAPSTRKFADFMLYDFIGCWAGDIQASVLKIAEGSDPESLPNHIVRVIITTKPGMLD